MGAAADTELLGRIVRNPGRLVANPTSTSGSFPYGGTPLGFVRELELAWDVQYYESRDPASGAVVEVVERRVPSPRLSALVEGPAWDEDVLEGVFSQTSKSATLPSQTPAEIRIEGSLIPRVVPPWPKLLFVADDPKGRSLLIRRPIPLLSLRKAIALAAQFKCGLPVVFVATPDLNYRSTPHWQAARLGNLTL